MLLLLQTQPNIPRVRISDCSSTPPHWKQPLFLTRFPPTASATIDANRLPHVRKNSHPLKDQMRNRSPALRGPNEDLATDPCACDRIFNPAHNCRNQPFPSPTIATFPHYALATIAANDQTPAPAIRASASIRPHRSPLTCGERLGSRITHCSSLSSFNQSSCPAAPRL